MVATPSAAAAAAAAVAYSSASPWVRYVSEGSYPYFINTATGEVKFSPPQEGVSTDRHTLLG
eukprot:SAG25_NODE_883_length_4958_cov_2.115044_4_plen_62_part_00